MNSSDGVDWPPRGAIIIVRLYPISFLTSGPHGEQGGRAMLDQGVEEGPELHGVRRDDQRNG